ncbi:MAG TPA: thioredoxin family protein [Myxococcaceae bacterium]|nr:thioredoxin family protein [Myxococcaceae bacterium]
MNLARSKDEWLAARKQLLTKEKELTRMRDKLSAERRALPWLRVEKRYLFDTPKGQKSLADLFDGRSQLAIYHFMFAPDWDAGCKSCSFWAESFDHIPVHLAHRDVTFLAVSRAPLEKLQTYARRFGWSFPWVSSAPSDFNYDFNVSFRPEELKAGKGVYNYAPLVHGESDLPGVSVFAKDGAGAVFHTYSAFSRGIDALNVAYQYLDLVPKGRDEGDDRVDWLRRRDEYER